MHYRGVAALVVVGVTALGLVGCSNNPSPSSSGGATTLKVAGLAAGDHEGLVAVGDMFTKQTGIKLTISEDGSPNYATTLRTQLGAGTAPDVFFTFPGNGSPAAEQVLAKAGLLADLSSLGFDSKIPAAYKDAASYQGKPYVVPQTQGLIGVIYNQTAMDKAKLTPPTTFSGVLGLCAAAQKQGKTAFATGFADNFIPQMISYALTPTLVYGPDPSFAKQQAAGTATFENSGWKKAFQEYKQMADAGCFQKNFQGTSFNDSATIVAKGDALALVGVNAFMQQVLSTAPSGTQLKMEPMPATNDPSQTRIAAAFAAGYGVNAKSKNMSAALKFAKFLATPEAQNLYATKAAGLPVFLDSSFKADPALDPMLPYIQQQKFSTYPDQGWPNARVQTTHATVVQQLLAGQVSVDGALKQMDEAYKQGSN